MSIARFTTAFALSLLASQLALGDEPTCAAKKGATHTLKFKVKDDGCVEKVKKDSDDANADTLNVCETDTVVWKVSGKSKAIVFEGANPFGWASPDSGFKDKTIEGTIQAGTASQPPFKYSVKVDGMACVLDPKIIVDP